MRNPSEVLYQLERIECELRAGGLVAAGERAVELAQLLGELQTTPMSGEHRAWSLAALARCEAALAEASQSLLNDRAALASGQRATHAYRKAPSGVGR